MADQPETDPLVLADMKRIANAYKAKQASCPACGYCPHCGRSAQPWPPVPVYPRPYWGYPYYVPFGTGMVTGGGTGGSLA